jgi:hypothetical protein
LFVFSFCFDSGDIDDINSIYNAAIAAEEERVADTNIQSHLTGTKIRHTTTQETSTKKTIFNDLKLTPQNSFPEQPSNLPIRKTKFAYIKLLL